MGKFKQIIETIGKHAKKIFKHFLEAFKKNAKIIVIVFCSVSITAVAVILITKEKPTVPTFLQDKEVSITGEYTPKSREEILTELKKQQLMITDTLNSNITFASGEKGTKGTWTVQNVKENTVIQQVEVFFEDKLITKTTPIYPNQYITEVELLKKIESGIYEVIAYVNYYDLETKEYLNKAGYRINLTIG